MYSLRTGTSSRILANCPKRSFNWKLETRRRKWSRGNGGCKKQDKVANIYEHEANGVEQEVNFFLEWSADNERTVGGTVRKWESYEAVGMRTTWNGLRPIRGHGANSKAMKHIEGTL
jgi:hypothetical protein